MKPDPGGRAVPERSTWSPSGSVAVTSKLSVDPIATVSLAGADSTGGRLLPPVEPVTMMSKASVTLALWEVAVMDAW